MTTKILAVVTLSTSVLISCNKFKTQEQTGSNIKNLNIVSTPCMGIPERLAYVRDTLGYGNIVISQDANLKTAVLMQLTQVPDSYLKILSEAAKLPPKTYTNVNRETRTVPFQITITDTQLVGAGATYGGTYSEPFEIFLGPGDFNNSVVHELGHALHAKIFTKRYGENWQNDKSNRLTAIFEKAKQNMNIRDYGRTEENALLSF